MNTTQNRIQKLASVSIASLSLMSILSSCGGSAYRETSATTTTGSSSTSTTTTGTTTTNTTTTTTDTTTSLLPPIQDQFTLTGAGGVHPTYSTNVNTDNLLKVKITAGPAGQVWLANGTYSNYSAAYNCVSYRVTVLGQSTTVTLSLYGSSSICPNAPTNQTVDFSNRLSAGHNQVTVQVEAAGYDVYCSPLYGYQCSMHTVYQTHTVTGTVSIQVNGTSI